ncbi:hypothetical protein PybrP1_011886 [[Pythium] brassicae (nom. inval.)]|nr:hypothetical protein PybrP1_011886 [[Pythium] brassicae (nom. inval.)]
MAELLDRGDGGEPEQRDGTGVQPRRDREERAGGEVVVGLALARPHGAAAGGRELAQPRHLDRGLRPLHAVVVALAREPRAVFCLLLREHREHAEEHGHLRVELHAHDALGHGLTDVLEVHRVALDQAADADHGVDLLRRDHAARSERQLVRAGHLERHDVVLGHARLEQLLLGAAHERRDDLGVPLGVHDGHAQPAAVELARAQRRERVLLDVAGHGWWRELANGEEVGGFELARKVKRGLGADVM